MQALIEQSLTGVDRIATLNRGFNSAPADIFRTKDGWIIATVIGPAMFRRWTRMIGEEHWLATRALPTTSRAPITARSSRRV